MAISQAYTNTASISTNEYSLPNNTTYSAGSVIASTGIYQCFIDLSAMVAGDQYNLKVYEKVVSGGTTRTVYTASYVGVQASPHVVLPTLVLMWGWDFTLIRTAGADRSITWSIRKIA